MIDRSALSVAVVALAVVASGCLGAVGPGSGTDAPTDDGQSKTDSPTTDSPTTDPPTDRDGTDPGPRTGTPTSGESPGGDPVAGYEALVFDHAGTGAPAIEGGIAYDVDATRTGKFYVTTVGSAADAARFNHSVLRPAASAFVRETTFGNESLVVVQTFPASSHPDYRVESVRRNGEGLHVAVNDSSDGATADITVETLLLRVPGDPPATVAVTTEEGTTFDTATGVKAVTPQLTPTPEPTVSLPYTATDPAENVAEPVDLRVVNEGTETNGYRLTVVYHDRPECRAETPPCGRPTREVEIFDRWDKLRPGGNLTVPDLAARRGTYTVTVTAELPTEDGDGEREPVTESVTWTVDDHAGYLLVEITDDDVTVRKAVR